MIDLDALYHDWLDAIERSNRKCPACDGSGWTRADRGFVRCRFCSPADDGDRQREAAVRLALHGGKADCEVAA